MAERTHAALATMRSTASSPKVTLMRQNSWTKTVAVAILRVYGFVVTARRFEESLTQMMTLLGINKSFKTAGADYIDS